jgi:hypothetical protein
MMSTSSTWHGISWAPGRNTKLMKKKTKYLLVAVVVLIIVGYYFFHNPLPSLGRVERMTFSSSRGEWDIPRKYWPELYSAMLPAWWFDSGIKWVIFGNLVISTSDGGKETVDLFDIEDGFGGFLIDNTHYRGGSSARLKQVLTKAKEEQEALK